MALVEEKNEQFQKKFNLKELGYINITPFNGYFIGFSVMKKLNKLDEENITLLSIYMPNKIYLDDNIDRKKPLSIHATYGKKTENGVAMRYPENSSLSDPLNVQFDNEYFYDIETEQFYHHDKKVDADYIINDVYSRHIKTAKPLRGVFIRFKLLFFRKIISRILKYISSFLYWVLFLISGNSYSYEPAYDEEKINDTVIKSRINDINRKMKEVLKEGEKFDFFGYKATRWSIIIYSVLHLLFFLYYNSQKMHIEILAVIAKNNFLIIMYAILSFWLIEAVVPRILMYLIKFFSTKSTNFAYATFKP